MPDLFTTDTRDRGLELVFLDFVALSPISVYLAARLLFLVLIISFVDFVLQVVNFYSSVTKLDKFYTVNVLRGNDLSHNACKKVQGRSYNDFPAKRNFKNCHTSCSPTLKNSKRKIQGGDGYLFGRTSSAYFAWQKYCCC